MRVLSTVTGSQGHARAVLPMVRALAQAGHEVLVILPTHLADVYAECGAQVEPIMPDFVDSMKELRSMRDALDPEIFGSGENIDTRMQMIGFAAGPHVSTAYHVVLERARSFQPDIILRDGGELSGCLVAEKLGLPHISAPSGAGNLVDPDGVAQLLNQRRAELGLPEQDDKFSIYRYGRISCLPHAYNFAAFDLPEPFEYAQPLSVDGTETLPAEYANLSGDKPLVLASVGTSLPVVLAMQMMGIPLPDGMADPAVTLSSIIGGLSRLDCHGIVSTGGLPTEDMAAGPGVQIADWVPQPLLLQCAQVFLTHGGYNSIREGMRAGVPMAVLPQYSDQHHNAARIEELGLGVHVTDVSPEGIAAACSRLLTDERIIANVRAAQRRILGLPGMSGVITHLEKLAAAGAV
ncbi:glycosyltransferase [Actinoplanes sp. NPDC026623]|jgi:N-glycosyltransferase|uniref:glycosyltransferase n=1 Tax=Actinoplanes sp. NPDC026623 TaxID=3155610 RepID=UPI0033DFB3B4